MLRIYHCDLKNSYTFMVRYNVIKTCMFIMNKYKKIYIYWSNFTCHVQRKFWFWKKTVFFIPWLIKYWQAQSPQNHQYFLLSQHNSGLRTNEDKQLKIINILWFLITFFFKLIIFLIIHNDFLLVKTNVSIF